MRDERADLQRARRRKRSLGTVRIERSAIRAEAVLRRRGHRERHDAALAAVS